ncbi:MAG: tripartite tricarboxylate transporter substrate binding protein [Proteobacteria bacterium]|nr:tripartite tricarboxylate transporter substrate binding protein [Pseudomonadota bacterium]
MTIVQTLTGKLFAFLTGLLLATSATASDPFPAKPVMLMVPYPAGGLSDVIARLVNTPLAKQLGQPVLVENLGGASGAIAAQKVLSAPADGYHLLQGSPNELILSPLANTAVKFKSEDFRLVQMIGFAPMVILARKDLPANSADELVALARSVAKTRPLTFGSVGFGSFYHVLGEHLAQTIGAPMTHVPYKGGAPLVQDLSGGQLDLVILPVSQQQLALADQGRIKIIASINATRTDLPALKGIPTVNEGKLLNGFNFSTWTGYFVRKDTPEDVVQRLSSALAGVLSDPQVRSQLEAQNTLVAQPISAAQADKMSAPK